MALLLCTERLALNVLSSAQAVNNLMIMFTGFYQDEVRLTHQMNFIREPQISEVEPRPDEHCLDCNNTSEDDAHVEIALGFLTECVSHRDFVITSRREAFANDAALGRDLARENSKEMC
jgi:hypothetical protein